MWEGTSVFSGGGCHCLMYCSLLWHFLCLVSIFFPPSFHCQSYLCSLVDGGLSTYILFPGDVQSTFKWKLLHFWLNNWHCLGCSRFECDISKISFWKMSFSHWKLFLAVVFHSQGLYPCQLFSTELYYSNLKLLILNEQCLSHAVEMNGDRRFWYAPLESVCIPISLGSGALLCCLHWPAWACSVTGLFPIFPLKWWFCGYFYGTPWPWWLLPSTVP